jgi:hypothetical protein
MTMMMVIKDSDWTLAGLAKSFEDEETPAVAIDAANTVHAWVIVNMSKHLGFGWTFTDGAFETPYTPNVSAPAVLALMTEAIDFAVEHLDEIRAEAEAEAV